jgi:hypothetical protein
MGIAAIVLTSVIFTATPPNAAPPQTLGAFVPVGVRYRPPADAKARQRDLEEMRRLRFNIVLLVHESKTGSRLAFIDRILAGAPYPDVPEFPGNTPALIPIREDAGETTLRAWTAFGRGARVLLFDDWAALQRHPRALAAAAAFAESVTRNASLYAPLRPRPPKEGQHDVRVAGTGRSVAVSILESADAIVIVAVNNASVPQKSVITFSPEMPEAIWQNMMTGATVHFVTRAEGPTYTRTFAPREVLVLMINTRLR